MITNLRMDLRLKLYCSRHYSYKVGAVCSSGPCLAGMVACAGVLAGEHFHFPHWASHRYQSSRGGEAVSCQHTRDMNTILWLKTIFIRTNHADKSGGFCSPVCVRVQRDEARFIPKCDGDKLWCEGREACEECGAGGCSRHSPLIRYNTNCGHTPLKVVCCIGT